MTRTGEPEPEVDWFKDGSRIVPSKRDKRVKADWDVKTDGLVSRDQGGGARGWGAVPGRRVQ